MKVIYKYEIKPFAINPVRMPFEHKILMVGIDPTGKPCLWAEVDEGAVAYDLRMLVVATGRYVPEHAEHIGSFVWSDYVLHLYKR